MLSVWSNGREDELQQIAQQLLSDGSSRAYLSPNEHALFTEALRFGPQTWSKFINGQIPCQVRITEEPKADGSAATSTIDVDAQKLAFRVRYMLYDAAVPGLYGHSVPDISPPKQPAKPVSGQEDDEYDDDEPETEEFVPTLLDVEASEDEDIRGQARALGSYNKMFHTFEGDWDTLVKYKKLQDNDREIDLETAPKNLEKLATSVQFGAANLSLKHLLGVIENKRDDMSLTDVELRNLISDVRKNRSKWASEDRIGQEELYEACEKVVTELRATTEHSTAFLNKVSKRDAPNYYQVITYPMDLTTVMKKLKAFQYNTKKEFVDDLMIIWENCLTYNSDPKHFLRAHAIAMRKKTLSLIPLIPDIKVRNREEVEAEAQAEAQAEALAEEAENRGKGVKGKTQKRRRTEEVSTAPVDHEEAEVKSEPDLPHKDPSRQASEAAEASASEPADNASVDPAKEESRDTPDETSQEPSTQDANTQESAPQESGAQEAATEDAEDIEEAAEHIDADLDWESSLWNKHLTAKRSDYLYMRHQLFRHNRLQPNAPVLLRNPSQMGRFVELQRKFFTPDRQVRAEEEHLFEYDVASTLPGEPKGSLPMALPSMQDLPPTKFLAQGGLNDLFTANLNEVQKIRRICAKINTIKEMQMNPKAFVATDTAKYPDIADPEPDVSSRLPGAEPMYEPAIHATLRRCVSKISMASGFEACQLSAADIFTDIAGDYLFKTAKLLKESLENPDREDSTEQIFIGTLMNMGLPKISSLGRYITDDVVRYNRKLLNLKSNVSNILTGMLRPIGLDRYNDNEFRDNSDQFVLGQFSNDLGDDYFGFKEMGIDKELGLENIAIPFHLLQQKVAPQNSQSVDLRSSNHLEVLPDYPSVVSASLGNIIGLLRPFYEKSLENKRQVADGELVEDDKQGSKQKFTRPRVPVTGKIPTKRKPRSHLFIKPPSVSTDNIFPELSLDETTKEINGDDIDLALNAFESFGDAM